MAQIVERRSDDSFQPRGEGGKFESPATTSVVRHREGVVPVKVSSERDPKTILDQREQRPLQSDAPESGAEA